MMLATAVQIGLFVLSGVLLVSGLAKALDRSGTRTALEAFGVPGAAAGYLAWALPRLEVVLGVALLVPSIAWWAGVAAAGLLAVFSAAIGLNLARGERPDCHCFGQLYSRPIGPGTLARNAGLIMITVALLAVSDRSATGSWAWMAMLGWSEWLSVASGLVTLALGLLLIGLWHQQGRLLERIEELHAASEGWAGHPPLSPTLGKGDLLPDATLVDGERNLVQLHSALDGVRDTLLVFVNPRCGPCMGLLPTVAEWQSDRSRTLHTVVITSGGPTQARSLVREHALEAVYAEGDEPLFDTLGVGGTPAALVVRPDGRLTSTVVPGARAVQALVDHVSTAGPVMRAPAEPVVFDQVLRPARGRAS
jgi:hypothetical protein